MSEIKLEQIQSLEKIMGQIDDKLERLDQNDTASSERIEAIDKAIVDINKVLEEQKKDKATIYNSGEEAWGAKDIAAIPEGLSMKQVHRNVIIKNPGDSEIVKGLQTINDDVLLLQGILNGFGSPISMEQLKYWNRPHSELSGHTPQQFIEKTGLGKALNTATTGSGGYLVPEGWSAEILHDYEADLMVSEIFESFTMPNDPFNYPFIDGSSMEAYLRSEPTTDEPSKYRSSEPTTDEIQFSTKELAIRVCYTRKLDEDALITWLPELKRKIARRMAEGVEEAIINGDISTNHMDSDVVLSIDRRKSWKGLRKWASAESTTYDVTTGSTTFQASDGMRVMEKMGKFAIRKNEGVWFLPFTAYIQARAFDEFETIEKAGANAAIFTGQVAWWYGWPVLTTAWIRTDLNSSGVYQSGQTKTEFIATHHPAFRIGYRREETVEADKDIETGMHKIVATMRLQFRAVLPTGNKIVAAGINV